jgi:TolB-like protein
MKSVATVLVVVALAAFSSAQTTQPAPAAPASQVPGKTGLTKFFVAPFTETGGTMIRPGWLSSRLTDAVNKDITTFAAVQVVKPAGVVAPRPEEGDKAYLDQARQAGAEVAIVGQSSLDGSKLAISGQIIDVASGSTFGTFKAEGTPNDLFRVENSAMGQVRQLVAGLVGGSPSSAPSAGSVATTPNAPPASGSRYERSELARSLDGSHLRGIEIANSESSKYNQQPYHTVEEPDINFLLPYYGGYGYGPYYGWPQYSYYNPWFPYYGGGYSWDGPRRQLIIIQNNNTTNVSTPSTPATPTPPSTPSTPTNNAPNNPGNVTAVNRGPGFSGDPTVGSLSRANANQPPLQTRQPQVVPTNPPAPRQGPTPSSGNTMQHSPGYEIRPVERQPVRR